jgi:hypothetical protein
MPGCATPEERLFFQQFMLDRILVVRSRTSYHYAPTSLHKSGALIEERLERLAREGNMHLLGTEDLPAILQTCRLYAPRTLGSRQQTRNSKVRFTSSLIARNRAHASPPPFEAAEPGLGFQYLLALTVHRSFVLGDVSHELAMRD